jgi:hypothetical protein
MFYLFVPPQVNGTTISAANYSINTAADTMSISHSFPTISRADGALVNMSDFQYVVEATTITVSGAVLETATGQTIEYAIGTTNNMAATALTWQDGNTFSGRTPGSTYYVYVRQPQCRYT